MGSRIARCAAFLVRSLFAGIRSATARIVVWALACVASAACMIAWWPLGAVPFVMLAVVSVSLQRERGRPWG